MAGRSEVSHDRYSEYHRLKLRIIFCSLTILFW